MVECPRRHVPGRRTTLSPTFMPRSRQIVSKAVGQDTPGGSKAAVAAVTNFLGSLEIVAGGGGTAVEGTAVDYNLEDVAFEMSQVSEGYIMRIGLDDLADLGV